MPSTPFARLLIVDDEAAHMRALCKTLELEGYHTTGFTSANEALTALRGGEFDLLLTDLNMPEMDGISLLQAALAVDGDLACIMMTGQGSIPTAVNAMQVGALDYILKPFRPSVIVPVLARALGLRRLRMENAELGRRLRERTYELEAANQRVEKQHQLLAEVAAEAESANRAKSTFLSTMSHEIRTPLNAILGYAQLMSRDPDLGSDSKSNLNVICRSGEHLLGLINDVLDVSKIEAGRTELHPATFSLPGLLEDMAAMFRLRAEAKLLRFVMVVDGESVPYVVADEGKIRQTLINLLGNAIKFTNQGQITLHVTVEQRNANRPWLSARVEDTGSGMTEEEQQTLFELFSQVKRGVDTQEGTGLGLAISRKYARLMGGDITVTSSRGRGSTFSFEIPIERGEAGVAVKASAPHRVLGLRAGTEAPEILVVDDQWENRDCLMKLLASVGFSVRGAADGEAAIKQWEEREPRMILMDVHMPVMDGLEATRRIKADPRGHKTIIVALTASAMDEDRRKVSESGADDFLAKPCREDDLFETMGSLLNLAYDYEETTGTEGQPAGGLAALKAGGLGRLSPTLADDFRDAILNGDKRRLDKLILQMRERMDAGSANALQKLADRYEYDALTRLLEEACAK